MSDSTTPTSPDGPPRGSEAREELIQPTATLTLLERDDVRALLEQACPTAGEELDAPTNEIMSQPTVCLVCWLAGDRPLVQMDEWQGATPPPVKIDYFRVNAFTKHGYQWGLFYGGGVVNRFQEVLGEMVTLPPTDGEHGAINRIILFCSGPVELALPTPPSLDGSDGADPSGEPEVAPPAAPAAPATSPHSARPQRRRPPAEPTRETITPLEALALIEGIDEKLYGPSLESDKEAVGNADEVVLITYTGGFPGGLQVLGSTLARILAAGRGSELGSVITLPSPPDDRTVCRLLVYK
jgi:hypothetical protein